MHAGVMGLLIVCASGAAAAWDVPQAPLRFELNLTRAPTHTSAGYFVHIPDGGVLPQPNPQPHVVASDGTVLPSFVLWQNDATGMGVVFQAPSAGGRVTLYVLPATRLRLWTPASGLTPSAMLCTQSGRGGKADALALAGLGAVSSTVHYRNRAGVPLAPLSVPGDLSGRSGPCAIYMLTHVAATDPGRTWIAPIRFGGDMEVRVDGKALALQARIRKPAGTGQYVDLSAGLHRLEIFCWTSQGSAPRNGLMTLMWQTPKTSIAQMGGARAADLPFPGTSMWEGRKLHNQEIVRSGSASIVSAVTRQGGPVAAFEAAPLENLWFEGESAVMVYSLAARRGGAPSDTRYSWSFGKDVQVDQSTVQWLFEGGRDHMVSLTAQSDKGRSTCRVPIYPYTSQRTSLNHQASRARYLAAARDGFTAAPAKADPTASWSAAHWNNLFRCLELDKGRALLTHLVDVRWGLLEKKLSPERRALLQELALDFAPRVDPKLALKWIAQFERAARGTTAKALLKVMRAEVMLYYMDDVDGARVVLDHVIRSQQKDEAGELARIRMGDIAFGLGDLNTAMKIYGDVQNRSKHQRAASDVAAAAAAAAVQPAPKRKLSGLARSKAELQARRRKAKPAPIAPVGRSFAMGQQGPVAEWKMNALLDVSASENVKSLIEQGFLLEAKQALRRWEREFPLSKINGDALVNEARFYMAVKDWRRARAILAPYCEHVDASSFMPAAVEALLKCKVELKESDAQIVEFCKKMKKKLEFHPAGKFLEDALWQRR
jgi:hypothetical protein